MNRSTLLLVELRLVSRHFIPQKQRRGAHRFHERWQLVSAFFGDPRQPWFADGYWFDVTRRGDTWQPAGEWGPQELHSWLWVHPEIEAAYSVHLFAGKHTTGRLSELPPGWDLAGVVAWLARATETTATLHCHICEAEDPKRLFGSPRYPVEFVCTHIEAARCPKCGGLRWDGLDECDCVTHCTGCGQLIPEAVLQEDIETGEAGITCADDGQIYCPPCTAQQRLREHHDGDYVTIVAALP